MASSSDKLMKEMQKIASNAQIQVQKLANEATEKSFKYNTQEAATARAFNREEAKVSREWQEYMSNTSHQREVADLRASGLNPVLSANSGAQSYTSASASAQNASASANDPSSSIGALAGQLMQSKTGAYQADTSAKATRAAAASAAAAQKYAANMNYRAAQAAAYAQMYSADKSKEAQVYRANKDYEIAMKKPQSNPFSIADKYLGNIVGKSVAKTEAAAAQKWKTRDFANSSGEINKNNFVLSKLGKIKANNGLNRMDIVRNDSTRKLYTQAFVFGDKNAAIKLARIAADSRRNAYDKWNRSGSGVW